MSNIRGYSPPNDTTVGAVGDIYTDVDDGVEYKCVGVHEVKSDTVTTYYSWVRVNTGSGSGGGTDEMPSGGGGGGGLRLIASVTLTEDAGSIEISKDQNGNDFELEEFVYTIRGKSLGQSGNIGLKINGLILYYSTNLNNTNATAELAAGARGVFTNEWHIQYKERFDASVSSQTYYALAGKTAGKMKSIWYGCTNGDGGFQAGTNFELWGR